MKKRYFNSIQFIRIFAFLNVFLLHAGAYRVTSFQENAAWAVSFFIMISGFLYGYQYYRDSNLKISSTIRFFVSKLFKVYPLYFLMTLLMFPFSEVFRVGREPVLSYVFKKIFYNLFLIQSFHFDRKINYAFTGVGWFLSTFMFLMLLTIPLICLLKKFVHKKAHILFILLLCFLSSMIYTEGIQMIHAEASYFAYIFPFARLFEYVSGILLGFYCSAEKIIVPKLSKKIVFTFLELGIFVVLIFLFTFSERFPYFNSAVLWILPNLVLIYIFSKEYGFLSKIFALPFFTRLGSLTFDAYLIHEVLLMYVYIVPSINVGIRRCEKLGILLFCLFMSFLFAEYHQKNSLFDQISKKMLEYF